MRNFLDDSIVVHNSKPPLRWIANVSGSIMSKAIWKVSCLDEDENYGWRYKFYGKIYSLFSPLYMKYGTFYKLDLDLSGKEWDDYDENGVPYWGNWDYEDPETGDAFRVISFGSDK